MGGYLATYRSGEERRHQIIKRLVITAVTLLVIGLVLYFMFRNYREEQKIKGFVAALKQKNYDAAYGFWGCSAAKPCKDYDLVHFMEDWGPKGRHPDIQQARLTTTKSCREGIIQTVEFPDDKLNLWVERKDLVVGFAPWPVCNPRMQVPVGGQ
jgi:hypothetical protein